MLHSIPHCVVPLVVPLSRVLQPSVPTLYPYVEALEASHPLAMIVGGPHLTKAESSLSKYVLLSLAPQFSSRGPSTH